MLRWCDAVNKYDFIIQHRSGAKHQNADALSRMRLTTCGWTDCPDCSSGIAMPFVDEDESVLTRHDEELIVRPPPPAADEKAHSGVLLARTKDVQASTAPPRRSSRLAVAGKAAAIAPELDIPAPRQRADSSPPEVARGKAAFMQKQKAEQVATGSGRVLRGQAKLEAERERTPEITVETRAVKASLASSEETRAKAPAVIAVPQRARGMPPPTMKVGEMGKSAHSMVTRGQTVTPAASLPAPAPEGACVAEQSMREGRRTRSKRAKRRRVQTDMVEPNARDLERPGAPKRRPCYGINRTASEKVDS